MEETVGFPPIDEAAMSWASLLLENLAKKSSQNTDNKLTEAEKDDQGKPAMHLAALVPMSPLVEVGRIYEYGAKKYGPENWKKGLMWSRVFGAVLRHLWKFWEGEYRDQESGLPHLAHAAWGCLTLLAYDALHPEMDDRKRERGWTK